MPTSGALSRVSRVTILFVDGDADARFTYQSVASGEGFGVELAAGGYEAIALANVLLPDVVVLDLRVPDLDGLEVALRLRASSRTCAIPIVLVTEENTERVDAAVRASGCDGHLVKPFPAEDLFRLVQVLAIRRRDRVPTIRLHAGLRPTVEWEAEEILARSTGSA